MSNTDPLTKKRAAPILTHDIYEQWFHLMSLYFRSKKIYYVTTTTLQNYAKVLEYNPKQKEPLTTASSSKDLLTIASFSADTPIKTPEDSLTKKTQRLLFNIKKKDKWRVNNAEAQYQIKIYLDKVDQTQVRHLLSVKKKWESLKKKYTTVLPITGHKYLDDLIAYKKPDDIFILEAWQHLHELKRKVTQTQPVVADVFGDEELL